MELKTVSLIYFSPTGTTRKVVEGIADSIGADSTVRIDLTRPDAPSRRYDEIQDGLAILGAPVYGGRIPEEAAERFALVKGSGVPAVVVAVYGNREYEDALIEMREIAIQQGFKPIAAGAFIGEHSYSTEDTPLAAGRPDIQDIDIARDLGKKVADKIAGIIRAGEIGELSVPGNLPFKDRHEMKKIPPATDTSKCMMCQICVGSCPTAAITVLDDVVTEADLCILCAACIKICPAGARSMVSPQVAKAKAWISETCKERKEPEIYLD